MSASSRVGLWLVVLVAVLGAQVGTGAPVADQSVVDPETDQIGWENGYWHNDSIDIDQTDGLSDAEMDAFLARSMARVEQIRGLEFTEPVEIEFVERSELAAPRNDLYGLQSDDQLWEALFFYGESTNATRAVRRAMRSAVLGYAAEEGSDRIVIVRDPSKRMVSGGTLHHELAHMLQHQQFNLSKPRYRRSTVDGESAKDGLVEGEASAITQRYLSRCGDEWSCVDDPPDPSTGRSASARFHRLISFPYTAGFEYVSRLIGQGGWAAVTAAHKAPPVSTEQVLHANSTRPTGLSVPDRSTNGWNRLTNQTLGETGIYALFWRASGESPISEANRTGGFTSQPSSGWGNDRLYSYANGDQRGYVWATTWDTERDAREFREEYIELLRAEGANSRAGNRWVITDGGFADAFSVTRAGTEVTIVNAPTVDALADIHARNRSGNQTTSSGTSQPSPTSTSGPGVGVLGAVCALVLGGLLRLAR